MAGLTPPPGFKPHIQALLRADQEAFDSLLATLGHESPALNAHVLSKKVIGHVNGFDDQSVHNIIQFAISSIKFRQEIELDAKSFSEAIAQGILDEPDFEVKVSEKEKLESRLNSLFSLSSPLEITAKAEGVVTDFHQTFCDCRILSDIRPIFFADVSAKPENAVIVHNLRIGYHIDREHHEFHLSLDRDDLEQLKETIERAIQKEGALTKMCNGTQVNLLTWE